MKPWRPDDLERVVREIVDRTLDELDPTSFWPIHPRDDDYLGGRPQTTLYAGAAGAIFGLHALSRRGFQVALDLTDLAWRVYRHWQKSPDAGFVPSLLLGESGLLLLLAELGEGERVSERLAEVIEANHGDPRRDLMWGSPGTLWVANRMAELTGDERWRALFREGARQLRATLEPEGPWLWTQALYGRRERYLGACHGAAGAHLALLAGRRWLEPAEADEVVAQAIAFARGTARSEGGLANWPATADSAAEAHLVQWCHGAPGVVLSLLAVPPDVDSDFEALLLEAGELVWRAGPLTKGASLCHGAAGNGYALLALHARTREAVWLERARAFAMHTLEQLRASWWRHGRSRPTLFTGHLGTAVFLADCLAGEGRFPVVG